MVLTVFHKVLLLALAGALGTLARYGLSSAVGRVAGSDFPWGTLVVNVVGCLIAGLLLAVLDVHTGLPAGGRTILMVGFLGAFTTFSQFIADTHTLMSSAPLVRAGANILLCNALGIVALFSGLAIGRHIA